MEEPAPKGTGSSGHPTPQQAQRAPVAASSSFFAAPGAPEVQPQCTLCRACGLYCDSGCAFVLVDCTRSVLACALTRGRLRPLACSARRRRTG